MIPTTAPGNQTDKRLTVKHLFKAAAAWVAHGRTFDDVEQKNNDINEACDDFGVFRQEGARQQKQLPDNHEEGADPDEHDKGDQIRRSDDHRHRSGLGSNDGGLVHVEFLCGHRPPDESHRCAIAGGAPAQCGRVRPRCF